MIAAALVCLLIAAAFTVGAMDAFGVFDRGDDEH